jgi:CBS domain-containing protein
LGETRISLLFSGILIASAPFFFFPFQHLKNSQNLVLMLKSSTKNTSYDSFESLTFNQILQDLGATGRAHPPVICVSPEISVGECLSLLAQHRILSVPIAARSSLLSPSSDSVVTVASPSSLPMRSRYAAVVNMMDLVTAVVGAESDQGLIQPVEAALPLNDISRESYRVWERDVDDTVVEVRSVKNDAREHTNLREF